MSLGREAFPFLKFQILYFMCVLLECLCTMSVSSAQEGQKKVVEFSRIRVMDGRDRHVGNRD